MGSSRIGAVDCEVAQHFTQELADRPYSDGVDYGANPLEVSITTNSTGPLNLVALVSTLVESGGQC